MTSPVDIRPDHLDIVQGILREHLPGGVNVWVFGSRADWTTKDSSDLDLALEGKTKIERKVLSALADAFEDSNLTYTVDIVDINRVSDNFRRIVEDQREPLPLGGKRVIRRSNWRNVTLGDFASFTYGKSLPSHKRNPAGKVPVFGSNGIVGYHDEALTDSPTIIIGRKGTVGAVHYSPRPCWPIDTTFFVTGHDAELMRFTYYALRNLGLEDMNSDSAVPGLNRNAAHARQLLIPDESEQRRIARILGTLDDKIELSRRMNATLEGMARALFKSWFVDFEPVRAKKEGRWRRGESLPGMPAEMYDLFPERLVPSEIGEVPEGWGVGTVDNIADSPRRGVSPADVDAETPYIGLQHMPRRSIALTEWGYAEDVTSAKTIFKKGEFLFGKLRPYFHKVGITAVDGVCSTDILIVVPNMNCWSSFLLCCLSSDEFVAYTDQTSTGTRMPRTSWKAMKQYEVCLPPNALVSAFQGITEPMLKRIIMNCHASQNLADLRDALLPGLVMGDNNYECGK